MIELQPAAARMKEILDGISPGALNDPTPCPGMSVGDLADHVGALSLGFIAAARKEASDALPEPSATNLGPDWSARIGRDLDGLVEAWRNPESWQGATTVGGAEMPGNVAGLGVLDELVVHGWDLAVATTQPYEPSSAEVEAAISFASSVEAPRDGSLFGPIVEVREEASPLERLLSLTGRDPSWKPVSP